MSQIGAPQGAYIEGTFEVVDIVPITTAYDLGSGALQRFDVYVEVDSANDIAGKEKAQRLYTACGSYSPWDDNGFRLTSLIRMDIEPESDDSRQSRAFLPGTTTDVERTIVRMAIQKSGKPQELCDADSKRSSEKLGLNTGDTDRPWHEKPVGDATDGVPAQAPGWGGDVTADQKTSGTEGL